MKYLGNDANELSLVRLLENRDVKLKVTFKNMLRLNYHDFEAAYAVCKEPEFSFLIEDMYPVAQFFDILRDVDTADVESAF